ncbi:MAG: endonuclease/exonuclease/phosphatase family protein [Xanthobacteraceae bacterium]
MTFTIGGIGFLLVLLTVLPLSPSTTKWVRVWDFPRTQVAFLLAITLLAGVLDLPLANPLTLVFIGAIALSLARQIWCIWPYTRLHAVQVKTAKTCPAEARFRILIANVEQGNRDSSRLLDIIKRHAPGVILLVETDQWWDAQLEPLMADYPHVVRHPQDNTYGMHLFSRFALEQPQIRYLVADDIPSIKAEIQVAPECTIVLYGVHPRPPPRADTAQRDAELVLIGLEARQAGVPVIVAGDLNDVAWSRTTDLFQGLSGLLDPRVGRGLFPTFNANWRVLRWPLDHVFISPEFHLIGLSVLPSIGSDHFPLLVELCYQPEDADRQPPPEPKSAHGAHAREIIAEGRDARCIDKP